MYTHKHLNSRLKYLELLLRQAIELVNSKRILRNDDCKSKVRRNRCVGALISVQGLAEGEIDISFVLLIRGELL